MRKEETNKFELTSQDFKPSYIALHNSGDLEERVKAAMEELAHCCACPRNCGVNRLAGETAVCRSGRYAVVASYHPHMGEEDPLRGWRGSGTIFFSWCNLRCVFCQNYDISQEGAGVELDGSQLAAIMLRLQNMGCHNINLVTPEHVVPQILEALPLAVARGLNLPLVYNTSAYDSLASLKLLDGIVDIYMPDFKIWDDKKASRYLKARNYPEIARQAIKEMHRQVGVLKVDERGLARRGVLVRHLVMPGDIAGTAEIMRFLAEELSPDTYINLMDQYYPAGRVTNQTYNEINRRLHTDEYKLAFQAARDAGLWRFDRRQLRHIPWWN